MIRTCNRCRSELGPWEDDNCLKCDSFSPSFSSIADLAVLVLEQQAGAITPYDIRRMIIREFNREIIPGSLAVILSSDKRFCWAGKSIYGLFRHRLLPGPR